MKNNLKSIHFYTNIIGLLIGFLILSIVIFRSYVFFNYNYAIAYIFNIAFSSGLLIISYFSFRTINFKGIWGIACLIFLELLSFLIIKYEIEHQSKLIFSLPRKNFIYSNMANTIQYDNSISEFNAELGYKYLKNTKATFEQWEFNVKSLSTNSYGLRDDETSLSNPRIISLGDSFCTGWGVEQNETYTDIIEKKLKTKSLNAGISSFGTIREGIILKKLDKDSLNLVILQYCLNDYQENKTWADSLLRGAKFLPSNNEISYKKRVVQNDIQRNYFPLRFIFEIIKEGFIEIIKPQIEEINFGNKETIALQTKYFVKSIQLIRRFYKGKILIISLSNSPKRLDPLIIENAKREVTNMSLHNIAFLDVGKVLNNNDNYYFDGHLTKSGHQKVANQLINFIQNSNY
jgi:hypothetical protein